MPVVSVSGNLPVPLTTFIGRRVEMREVSARLERHRLVTITGVGGCGKSRLGVETATAVRSQFTDGTWLVELASVSDPETLSDVVNTTLRLGQEVGPAMSETLLSRLVPCQLLLVLDNCEHLVGAVAELVELILTSAPNVRVLTTSRERLGITGETLWRVPGLRVPDEDVEDMSALAGCDSVQLFVERAQAVEPDFQMSSGNARAVSTICRRLDGLPLAIELAAARVGSRGIEVVRSEMTDPFHFLTVGSRTASPRHRTLTAVVEWSYQLLDDAQQRVFDRVSVFAGGFSREAAIDVCSLDLPGEEVGEALGALVDKSLVTAESVTEGAARYRVLETLRVYAAENLAARGETDDCRSRHAVAMLSLAEEAWDSLRGSRQREWLERLELEHSNLRAALGRLLERGEGEAAQALAGALAPFWDLHGHYGEGRQWLTRALEHESPTTSNRVRATNGLAELTLIQGDFERAIELFEEAARLAEICADEGGAAYALQFLGLAGIYAEDLDTAEVLLDQSATAARQAGDEWLTGWAGIFRCALELQRDRMDRALLRGHEAREHIEATGEPEGLAWSAVGVGAAAWRSGDLPSARRWLGEGLRGFWELGGSWGISLALAVTALLACSMERTERGIALLAASESLRESMGVALLPFFDRWQEQTVQQARLVLGPQRLDEIWQDGTGWSLDDALRCATEILHPESAGAASSVHGRVTKTRGASMAPVAVERREGVLRRDADYWTVALDGPAFRLRHTTGLAHLSRLVASPGLEFHALDLAAAGEGSGHLSDGGSAMPVLDETAKTDYRRRLQELAAELEEAEDWADAGRTQKIRLEIDLVTDRLVAAMGLAGRDRPVTSEAERARVNVTKAIRSAIRRIAVEDAALGRHLDVSVRTGMFCCYAPDPAAEVDWRT
jgi:non-specific serine/threonine protein kinase